MKRLLEKNSVVILLGAGGVGKTTVAASLGIAAAISGLNTAVVTIDPAKRLRDALGLRSNGTKPLRLSSARLASAGLAPDMELSALMLDSKSIWDEIVNRFARSPQVRERLLANSFYQRFASHFAGSETFASLEQLYRLHEEQRYDIQIVDTPPAAHAVEFLDAPTRLTRLLTTPGVGLLFRPPLRAGRIAAKLASRAARFVVNELERFTGRSALVDAAQFFSDAAEMVSAVAERFNNVNRLLQSEATKFVLVTTAEPARLSEAARLAAGLKRRGVRLSAVVVNRFADPYSCEAWLKNRGQEPLHLRDLECFRKNGAKFARRDAKLDAIANVLENYRARFNIIAREIDNLCRVLAPEIGFMVVPEILSGVSDLRSLAQMARLLVAETSHAGEA